MLKKQYAILALALALALTPRVLMVLMTELVKVPLQEPLLHRRHIMLRHLLVYSR